MGITVSESNAVLQQQQNSNSKRLQQQSQIRKELATSPSIKSPHRPSQNRHYEPQTHTSHSEPIAKEELPSAHNFIIPPPLTDQPTKTKDVSIHIENQPQQSVYFQPIEVNSKSEQQPYQSPLQTKSIVMQQELPTTTPKKSLEFTFHRKLQYQDRELNEGNQSREELMRNGSNRNSLKHGPASNPNLMMENERESSNFDLFDWTIPSESEIKHQGGKRDQLPSMNLVLANKFNEDTYYLQEIQGREQFNKNRRQIMRDLLSGKRKESDGFLQGGAICGCAESMNNTNNQSYQ